MTAELTAETPESLTRLALTGRMPKQTLASLLVPESRRIFLAACAAIEKQYTDACATSGEPCLESGCSCEGEVCLQPLLRAGSDYRIACGAEWVKQFSIERNRESSWRVTSGVD